VPFFIVNSRANLVEIGQSEVRLNQDDFLEMDHAGHVVFHLQFKLYCIGNPQCKS